MSGIKASLDRVFYSTVSFIRDNAVISLCTTADSFIEASITRVLDSQAFICRDDLSLIRLIRSCSGKCTFTRIKDHDTQEPYLEISPEIIWVYDNLDAYNDVYSNVTWNVN